MLLFVLSYIVAYKSYKYNAIKSSRYSIELYYVFLFMCIFLHAFYNYS
jgi:hypothetical protein